MNTEKLIQLLNSRKENPVQSSQDIVEGLLPIGLTFLFAPAKSYKSFISKHICEVVSDTQKETTLFDCKINQKGIVFYYVLDDSIKTVSARFKNTSDNLIIITKDGYKYLSAYLSSHGYPTSQPDFFIINAFLISKLGNPKLVVIDTFEKIRASQTKASDRSYSSEIYELEQLKAHAELYGYSCLVIHHTTKNSFKKNTNIFESYYGSNGLGAEADVLIAIEKNSKTDLTLHVIGNSIEERDIHLHRNEDMTFSYIDDASSITVDDYPGKDFSKIIYYFTNKQTTEQDLTLKYRCQDFVTELNLEINPLSLTKYLKSYSYDFETCGITFEFVKTHDCNLIVVHLCKKPDLTMQ